MTQKIEKSKQNKTITKQGEADQFADMRNTKMISLRVPAKVIDFYKAQGPGYQRRMREALVAAMEANSNASCGIVLAGRIHIDLQTLETIKKLAASMGISIEQSLTYLEHFARLN